MDDNENFYCQICGAPTAEYHHWIHTRGARPDLKDAPWNLLPLCRLHHMQAHNLGRERFYQRYKSRLTKTQRQKYEEEVHG